MTSLGSINKDFRDLLLAFLEEKVEFLIVGAYALAFHGVPRATGDIDFLVRPSAENSQRVFRALIQFGAPLSSASVRETFVKPGMIYQIGVVPRRIDVITEISGMDFDEAWSSRVADDWDGRTVYFIGREALIKNKLASGRPKDLGDADRLRR